MAHRLGLYFRHRGNYAEARRLLKQAIEIKQKAYTHDHPTLATTYSHLGIVEQELGNLTEARELLREALAINELAYAHDHPTLAASYSNLGLLEYTLGNLPEARRRLGEALDVSHKAYAPGSAAVADACFHLALVEQELGNTAAASGHMRKTCIMRLTLLGEKHPATKASIEWLMTNDEEFRKAIEDKEREADDSRGPAASEAGERD
jgi:tetratricopeptide (TPR) repeat protein